jgi:hypothetical protein
MDVRIHLPNLVRLHRLHFMLLSADYRWSAANVACALTVRELRARAIRSNWAPSYLVRTTSTLVLDT